MDVFKVRMCDRCSAALLTGGEGGGQVPHAAVVDEANKPRELDVL